MSLPVLGQVVEERVELVDVCAAVAGRARLVDAHLVVAVRHRPDGRGGVAEARLAGARLLQAGFSCKWGVRSSHGGHKS